MQPWLLLLPPCPPPLYLVPQMPPGPLCHFIGQQLLPAHSSGCSRHSQQEHPSYREQQRAQNQPYKSEGSIKVFLAMATSFFVMCNLGQIFLVQQRQELPRGISQWCPPTAVSPWAQVANGWRCLLGFGGHGTSVYSLPKSVMTNCIFDGNGAFCSSHTSFMDFQSLIFREVFFDLLLAPLLLY